MLKGLIGTKVNMSQTFDKHGRVLPITIVKIPVNTVLQIKSIDKDGYKKAQVGAVEKKKDTKPHLGHIKKAGLEKPQRFIHEFDFDGELNAGQSISVGDVFKVGSMIDVTGISKGKGFAGVIKRWGFHGGPKTHGQSDRERAPGSIGATTTPGRVFKGMKMAGHMGNSKVTVSGLEIVSIDTENSLVSLKGSVPGSIGSCLLLRKSKKKRRSYHEPEIHAVPQVSEEKSEEKTEISSDQNIEKTENVENQISQ